ncbi:MAG: hypothetical protein HC901_01855 [Bdellovibrionaceae bacterium]|nr:hypothetical protein [Pseudobdellovibrionaceae bacterium]
MINMLEDLFQRVLEISWQASLLVLAVLLVQTIFRKWLNPRWYYALWLLVVLRLLLPVTPESPVSGYGYLPQAPINREGEFVNEAPLMDEAVASQAPENPDLGIPTQAEAGRAFQLSVWHVLSLIWLTGLVAWGLFLLLRDWNFRKRLQALPGAQHPVLTRALGEACALLRIKDRPRLVEAGFVASPCLTGVFRPVILLPANSAGRFNAEELRLILVHELAHYQRGDLIVQWLVTWLQAVHWFNPVLWFAFRRMRLDREPATDALVLDRAGVEARQSYGNALITLLQGFNRSGRGQVWSGFWRTSMRSKSGSRFYPFSIGKPMRGRPWRWC